MKLFVVLLVSALAISSSFAYDPSPLQDFCVATNHTKKDVSVNGKFCKNPKDVTAEDFFYTGLNIPRDTNNTFGYNVTTVDVNELPGLNTLGISSARIDFAPEGVNPPHTHPRATEIFYVSEGTVQAGFVTSDQLGNKLISKVLNPGDMFVFPLGLIHFQYNVGNTTAVAFSSLSSQNPGSTTIAPSTSTSKPRINPDVLTKALQVRKKVIGELRTQFGIN